MLRSLSTWDFVKIIGPRTTEEGGDWTVKMNGLGGGEEI